MEIKERQQRTRNLLWLLVPGISYIAVFYFRIPLTGIHQSDGIAGVLLGLFMCANPAANLLDAVLFKRSGRVVVTTGRLEFCFWVLLNFGVVFAGWLSIVDGLLIFAMNR
jgi:hypothetical protein